VALSLANRYPNVWLELASQSLWGHRKIFAEAPPDRICFGSDWPFYPVAFPLAKVLLATEGNDDLRHAVLRGNAARLLGLPS
jgi:predicted TIM-barrel fold metal-dependent hydrolase